MDAAYNENQWGDKKQYFNFTDYNDFGQSQDYEANCKKKCYLDSKCDAYLMNGEKGCNLYQFKNDSIASYKSRESFNDGGYYGNIKKKSLVILVKIYWEKCKLC